jgi:hypothetical protein
MSSQRKIMNSFPRHADDTEELARTANQVTMADARPDERPAPDVTVTALPGIDLSEADKSAGDQPVADDLAGDPAAIDDLAEDPFADDLNDRLDAMAPKRWVSRSTVVLAALVLIIAGFVGGAQVQKHWGTPAGASASNNPFAGGAGGLAGGAARRGGAGGTGSGGTGGFTGGGTGGFNGGGGTAAGGAGGTTGTVKLVDGNTVYITTASGQTVIVKTTGSTSVSTSTAGSLKDLTAGSTVTIQGQAASDGSVTATKITKN